MIGAVVITLLALIVILRAIQVCNALWLANKGDRSHANWEGFGLSYCVLLLAAGATILETWTGLPFLGHPRITLAAWVIGSAGLIAFDRRREWTKSERG